MADWTPPEAMVEEVAQQVLERLFTVNPTTKPGTERVAREVVRATLAASPIGELTQQRDELVEALAAMRLHYHSVAAGRGTHAVMAKADAALARARGEK